MIQIGAGHEIIIDLYGMEIANLWRERYGGQKDHEVISYTDMQSNLEDILADKGISRLGLPNSRNIPSTK